MVSTFAAGKFGQQARTHFHGRAGPVQEEGGGTAESETLVAVDGGWLCLCLPRRAVVVNLRNHNDTT
jgi:hypothetical protein